jgi:hypothetical protein
MADPFMKHVPDMREERELIDADVVTVDTVGDAGTNVFNVAVAGPVNVEASAASSHKAHAGTSRG